MRVLLALIPLLLAACAAEGDFPSLKPRPIELALAEEANAEQQAAPEVADNAEFAAELTLLKAAAARTLGEVEEDRQAARTLVARAGGEGSDSWLEAQQALSRLEAARNGFADLLVQLDEFARRYENQPLSATDRKSLEDAVAEFQARADAEQRELAALAGRLNRP